MNYVKKLVPITIVALGAVVLTIVLGALADFSLVAYLVVPFASGICFALCQKETVSYKFLDKIVIGSLLFDLLLFLWYLAIAYWEYRTGHFQGNTSYNFLDHVAIWSVVQGLLALDFLAIVGGLVGIVIRGAGILLLNKRK